MSQLTCYLGRTTGAFTPRYEDDIALAGICVVVLQEEELVDSVLLKRRNFHDGADGAGQAALEDEIELAADLVASTLD